MSGPVIGFGYTNNVINKDVWDSIPTDLQQIIIEEGAKAELEALRLAPFQNIVAVQLNQQLGIQYELFSEEIMNHIHTVVMAEHVIPGWLRRLGYPGRNADVVALANDKLAPYMGLFIAEDGSVEQVPITKGFTVPSNIQAGSCTSVEKAAASCRPDEQENSWPGDGLAIRSRPPEYARLPV